MADRDPIEEALGIERDRAYDAWQAAKPGVKAAWEKLQALNYLNDRANELAGSISAYISEVDTCYKKATECFRAEDHKGVRAWKGKAEEFIQLKSDAIDERRRVLEELRKAQTAHRTANDALRERKADYFDARTALINYLRGRHHERQS